MFYRRTGRKCYTTHATTCFGNSRHKLGMDSPNTQIFIELPLQTSRSNCQTTSALLSLCWLLHLLVCLVWMGESSSAIPQPDRKMLHNFCEILARAFVMRLIQGLSLPLDTSIAKRGYIKFQEACLRALDHELQYAWIDTCCIDKTSSAELTESINSMFEWYKNTLICFVYLSDLQSASSAESAEVRDRLSTCRWFTRG